ncbi:MAG: DegV family protein [Oscillospiraceae bacterium]|nr:DegV family protein [Oscillospiraceae bacterium]
MTWRIVADSSCDLTLCGLATGEDVSFGTVPLKIVVGEEVFTDDASLDLLRLRQALADYPGRTSSACPSPAEWAQEFAKADQIIAVTMTSALSGTYNSALIARDMMLEKEPGKKIHVIDTRSTAGHMVLLCREISRLIDAGKSFEEVCEEAEKYNREKQLLFTLRSFDTLIKNGRMNKLTGALASCLGMRAVGRATEKGELGILHKTRGEARAFSLFLQEMEKRGLREDAEIYLHHCRAETAAKLLYKLILKKHPRCRVTVLPCRGLTGYYAGEGGILAAF